MGNSTLYFIDTDLHDIKAEDFHRELEHRIGAPVTLRGYGNTPYADIEEQGNEWSLICGDTDLETAFNARDILLRGQGPGFFTDIYYYGKTFEVDEIVINNNPFVMSCGRFNLFCRDLSENRNRVLKELSEIIRRINKYLKPITHSTRLFLCGDQVYDDDKGWHGDFIMENGASIDQALEFNSKCKNPDPVYTWDILDNLMKEYIGWGIFDFNLEKLPPYISSIS